jgi:hypothetical protein
MHRAHVHVVITSFGWDFTFALGQGTLLALSTSSSFKSFVDNLSEHA